MSSNPLISIVDDDAHLRTSLENLIRSIGWRVQGFSSAEAFLRSNPAQGTSCLILDLCRHGMNGLELRRQMTGANSHVPIIFITADQDNDRRIQALKAGAVAFLYKPFYQQELLSAIHTALNGP